MSFLIPEASREHTFKLMSAAFRTRNSLFFFLAKMEGQNKPMTLNSKTLRPEDAERSRKTEQDRNARRLQQ